MDDGAIGHDRSACPFCGLSAGRVIAANEHAVAMRDLYPVSPGHSLVVPKRHIRDWWVATPAEREAIGELVDVLKRGLDDEMAPAGYNVGFNDGAAAGQTVFHLHVHVIPRFEGDVEDPRGGVRHVLPHRANYLVDPPTQSLESVVESRLSHAMDSSAFMQRVLAILDEGRRSATYKPALLMALVELSAERVRGTAPLELPLEDIAERVMELYWPQTRPHGATDGVLRQSTAKSSRIVDALAELRAATRAPVSQPLGQLRARHPAAYLSARDRIARALALQPIPRLQRPGAGLDVDEYPRFLYDDRDFASEKGWLLRGQPAVIRLLPGVADTLARSAVLLRLAAQDVWVREVSSINRLDTHEQQLRAFLFGADRAALGSVAEGLRDSGADTCFWCEESLRGAVEVDHVIPWSHYPRDDLFNLVLTDRECNNNKRDRLVSASLVERWTERDQAALRVLAVELQWPLAPERSGQIAGSAYRYLPDGVPVWSGRNRLEMYRSEDRDRIEVLVGSLIAGVG